MTATILSSRSSAVRPFLSAEWRYLAIVNYRVDPSVLEPLVPRGTRLDTLYGETYLSLVGFQFRDTRVMGLAVPGHRDFEELNLRFYVVREHAGETRRGVVFIKELAPRWAVCTVAKALYNENYQCVPMQCQLSNFPADGEDLDSNENKQLSYQWKTAGRWHSLHMNVRGPAEPFTSGSHEEFIVEHYWGYCRQRDGGTVEYEVEHPGWRLWHDAVPTMDCDFESIYGANFAPWLHATPVSAFVADGSAVTVSKPRRLAV